MEKHEMYFCISIAKIVAKTRNNITLFVSCLSCFCFVTVVWCAFDDVFTTDYAWQGWMVCKWCMVKYLGKSGGGQKGSPIPMVAQTGKAGPRKTVQTSRPGHKTVALAQACLTVCILSKHPVQRKQIERN